MDALIFTLIITHGRTFALYSGDVRKLVEDAEILKPTIMCAVPMVFTRIYNGIKSELAKKPKIVHNIELKIRDFDKRYQLLSFKGLFENSGCVWNIWIVYKNVTNNKFSRPINDDENKEQN